MNRGRKAVRRALITVLGCLVLTGLGAPTASGEKLEFVDAGVSVNGFDGNYTRQAGAHPDFTFRFSLAENGVPKSGARDIVLDLPPGILGNPTEFPTCTMEELVGPDPSFAQQNCPIQSQIGVAHLLLVGGVPADVGIFNIEHGPEVAARFGFNYLSYSTTMTARLRADGSYALSTGSTEISQGKTVVSGTLTFWGFPADPVHDAERQGPKLPFIFGIPFPSQSPAVAFMSNPTACPDSGATFTARGDSWEEPGVFDERLISTDEDGIPFIWEGCEQLPFEPEAQLAPGTHMAHSPTGLGVHIELPQNPSVDGLATSAAKAVSLTLPEGMTISPSVASGQTGCTEAQVGLGSDDAPTCPPNSRIGSIELDTPLLDETLQGQFVLAAQNDNPFNATYAVYMLIDGPGFWLKLPGELLVDRQTGQLRTAFDDLPQMPFEAVDVELEGGPSAPLSTPNACGTYTARSEITPWARPNDPVVEDLPMQITENCSVGGFAPGLKGGTLNPVAGKRSPFAVRISRQDGEQNVSRIDVTLPEGQLASLKGVAECPEAQAATGACPAASQIGVAGAAIGVGSTPLQVPQPGKAPTALFLGGPYKGAPLSLVALVPAQAGPFDLGNVVVRTALQVDPTTAQVTAKSDPLPQIIEGVPLQYRDIRIELTRPDFGVNPTSCDRMAITSTMTSIAGNEAHPSVPYQVAGCGELGFSPKLKISLKGKMNRTGNPAVNAVLKAGKGEANIAKTTVILPKSQFIDNAHINNPCTRVQFNANACPAGSILGQATAYTPLLDQPLSGPVYFRSNGGERELPDLVADLNGQIHVTLVGFIDSVPIKGTESSMVRTRFQNVPDAPVSKFVLKLSGGKKGLVENSRDLCSFTPRAKVQMTGQNGKTANSSVKLGTSCGNGKARRK